MNSTDDRRDVRRTPIRVLVRCLPSGDAPVRNGHDQQGWEMWARNIADDGVGLRWSRQWAERRYIPDFTEMDERPARKSAFDSPHAAIKKGQEIRLDGLVYNERGSKPMRGRVKWVRAGKKGDTFDLGVHITSPNHRSFFKALEG